METRSPGEQPPRGGWRFLLRALGHRNYRLFFAGQSVSLVGTWLTRVATAWLVYRLTGSAMLLGLVGFSGQRPSFPLGPFAGVLVDRWNRHRLLVINARHGLRGAAPRPPTRSASSWPPPAWAHSRARGTWRPAAPMEAATERTGPREV